MEAPARQRYSFGPFLLDPEEKVLLRRGRPIALGPKALDTLVALIEHRGHVIEKAELLNRVWPNTFVEEATLTQNIFTLRKALDDSPEGHEYIETVPKRGYRFVAPVQPVLGESSSTDKSEPFRSSAGGSERTSKRLIGVLLLSALTAVTAIAVRQFGLTHPSGNAGINSLAVLPLANVSGDSTQDYLAEGLTDALITDLAKISALRVVSRASVMRYKGSRKPLREIARELGVDAIVEGSVLRSGNRLHVTSQLVNCSSDRHLWAENYDRDIHDLAAVESELALDVARHVGAKLIRMSLPQTVVASEVYEDYLRGVYFWNRRTESGYRKAIDYFQRAVGKDPRYAPPYAGLANSYILLGAFGQQPLATTMAQARLAASRALEIDENTAEAHVSMAYILSRYDWNWVAAEHEFRRAIDLSPGDLTAHHWYALHLVSTGRMNEAISEIRRAEQLDPASLVIATDVGLVLFYARQYDAAIQQCRKALEMDPDFGLAHRTLGLAYAGKAMYKEAIVEFKRAVTLLDGDPWSVAEIGWADGLMGRTTEALSVITHLQRISSQHYVSPSSMALAFAALPHHEDDAFHWLEKCYEEHSNALAVLAVDPRFDLLRADPRFADLLRRMGLPVLSVSAQS